MFMLSESTTCRPWFKKARHEGVLKQGEDPAKGKNGQVLQVVLTNSEHPESTVFPPGIPLLQGRNQATDSDK